MKIILYLTIALCLSQKLYAQFPLPYCAEAFASGVRPITKVTFSNVSNASPVSPAGPAHENFTGVTANVEIGRMYTVTLEGSTGGNFTDQFSAYFDWNGDGDFNDIFEQQYIGSISNSTGTDNQKAISGITVPANAVAGISRMRIVKKYNGSAGICNTAGFGQAEDYRLNITTAQPASFYVKLNATGSNNGSSWANAYTSLTNALYYAIPKDTIRVAAGTYKPGTSQINTFAIKDSMIVLGGYPNTGNPTDAQRNFSTYQTILSGEIGGPTPNDNIYNVVTIQDVTPSTVIDGFIIEKGYANYFNPDPDLSPGGGLKLKNAPVTLNNCVFRNNYGANGGSAISAISSDLLARNCIFINNGNPSDLSVILNKKYSQPVYINCVFFGNNGTIIMNDSSSIVMRNCTLAKNATGYSTTLGPVTIRGVNHSVINIGNSIFYANGLNSIDDSTDISLDASTATVGNTITQVFNTGNNPSLQNANPKFRDTSNFIGADNLYYTGDDGLTLTNPCSPAINAGSNSAAIGINTDIRGLPRIFGPATDLGAYEVQTAFLSKPAVLYVNKFAAGNNSGTTWANAFTDLQSALAVCSDTIKVAAGTYYPSQSNLTATFLLENHRVMLGGYPASGNPIDAQRDYVANPTILSANLPAAGGSHGGVIIKGRWNDNTSVTDGFILRDVDINPTVNLYNSASAAVYLIHHASPVFRNCVMQNNRGYKGAALNTYDFSSPLFYNCTFKNNGGNTTFYGGAVSNYTNSAPSFLKCSFKDNFIIYTNYSELNGGAMYNDLANPTIDSCTFTGNIAQEKGGAVFNVNNSTAVISNSFFQDNVSNIFGSDVYNEHSSATITNCVFTDSLTALTNSPTRYGAAVANIGNSTVNIIGCKFTKCNADDAGGAVFNKNSTTAFRNCLFSENSATSGAAVYNDNAAVSFTQCVAVKHGGTDDAVISNKKSNVTIIQSTIAANSIFVIENADTTHLTVKNSIFSDNNPYFQGNDPEIHNNPYQPGNTTDIYNSLTWASGTNGVNGNITGTQARFVDFINPSGPDGIFFTADDGLRLTRCSPAINAGDNSFAAGIPADVSGNNRIFGALVDMGAYEAQSNASGNGSIYVNAAAGGSNNGTSWANAYTSLTNALNNSCADTIRVAAGVYKPIAVRDSSFNFGKAKVVWGGFPATGNPTDAQRNPVSFVTILSGDIGVQNDSLDNNYHVVKAAGLYAKLYVDGFTVKNGNSNGDYDNRNGGGIFSTGGETEWSNMKIENNYAIFGGGMFNASKMKMTNIVFAKNHGDEGGAYYEYNGSINTTTVDKCVFIDNKGDGRGGAIVKRGTQTDSFRLTNNLFVNNLGAYGGAVYFDFPLSLTGGKYKVTNCTFSKNVGVGKGGALYFNNEDQVGLFNNIFYQNNCGTSPGEDIYGVHCNSNVACNPFDVQYNILQQYTTNTLSVNYYGPPAFVNENNPAGPDNQWFTNDDGYQLKYDTYGVNDGKNSFAAGISFDILGNNRIYQDTVDIGCYEFSNIPFANAGPDKEICSGVNVQIGTADNPAYAYSWTSSPAGFTSNQMKPFVNPVVTTSYFLEVSNGTLVSRDTMLVTVYNLSAPTVTITASTINPCPGSFVTFTATGTNQGPAPAYQWKVNGVNYPNATGPVFTYSGLQNNDQVSVVMSSSSACASVVNVTSNIITVTLATPVTPTITITSNSTGCGGGAITFTAAITNGGTNPGYTWTIDGSPTTNHTPTFTNAIWNNGDIVNCVLTGNAFCTTANTAVSNGITINTANSLTPSVSISASAAFACAGSPLTFTATPVYGGNSPVYQWKINNVNVGTNSPIFTTTTLQTNDQVKVVMTSSYSCASPATVTSNTISALIGTNPIAFAGNDVSICLGSSTQLIGGAGSSYSWSPATGLDDPTSPYPVATPLVTTAYVLTVANGFCIAKDTVVVTVNSNAPVTVNITSTAANICSGSSVTFTATPVNAGASPGYQWKVNGVNAGTNSPIFTSSSLQNSDQVTLVLASNNTCAPAGVVTSNIIQMSVTTSPVANAGNDVSICAGSNTQLNGSGGTIYSWTPATALSNAAIANPVATPAVTTAYILTVANGTCTSKDTVVVTVAQPTTPFVSITTANNPICAGSIAVFTAVALNAGSNPSYQWQVNGINAGTNSAVFTSSSLQNNAQIKVIVTSNGCTATPVVTSNVITLSVTTLAQPVVNLNGNVLTVTNPDAAALYTWQQLTGTVWNNIIPTASGLTFTVTQPGDYRVKAVIGSCIVYSAGTSAARNNVTDSSLFYIYLNPNPTRGLITVYKLELWQKWQSLDVLDMQGQIMLPSLNIKGLHSVSVHTERLVTGVYIIRLTDADGKRRSYRFIKE